VGGGNDVDGAGGWGGAEGSGNPLGEDVYGGECADVDGGVPLQQQNPCVRVAVQSRTASGGVVPDPFPDNPKVVH